MVTVIVGSNLSFEICFWSVKHGWAVWKASLIYPIKWHWHHFTTDGCVFPALDLYAVEIRTKIAGISSQSYEQYRTKIQVTIQSRDEWIGSRWTLLGSWSFPQTPNSHFSPVVPSSFQSFIYFPIDTSTTAQRKAWQHNKHTRRIKTR